MVCGSAIQVMLCLKRAAKTYDYPVCCRLAFARQHYLDTTTFSRTCPQAAAGRGTLSQLELLLLLPLCRVAG